MTQSKEDIEKEVVTTTLLHRDRDFIEAYGKCRHGNFIWYDSFHEGTLQWKMAYDPYKAESMAQIYGTTVPPSFKKRWRKLEQMILVLGRYAMPSPVQVQDWEYTRRTWQGSRGDYLSQKRVRIWEQDQADMARFEEEFRGKLALEVL